MTLCKKKEKNDMAGNLTKIVQDGYFLKDHLSPVDANLTIVTEHNSHILLCTIGGREVAGLCNTPRIPKV